MAERRKLTPYAQKKIWVSFPNKSSVNLNRRHTHRRHIIYIKCIDVKYKYDKTFESIIKLRDYWTMTFLKGVAIYAR